MTVEYVDAGEAIQQSALSPIPGVAPAVASDVNYERLLNARSESHNWLTYYGAYDGQRYSLLDQINTDNVKRIGPAWMFQAGASGHMAGASTYAFEACPLVVDGIMYVTGWDGWFWALDATNGQQLWRYKHATPFDVSLCCGNVNRGCAVANGNVYFVTPNAHLLALDATNGKTVWEKTIGDVRAGESATLAPLVVKNTLITGSSGGEFGVRGHIDWWDYDSTMEMTLFERDGKKLLGHFDKNGYFFVLDRTNGELQHVTPFVDRIDWGVITRDGKVTPRKYPDKEGEPVHFYPGPAGAKEWTHAAYSPKTNLFYVPVQDTGATATRRRREFKESIPYWGAAVQVDIDDMAGSVSAFDSHGEEKWRWRLDYPMAASVLATAGNLVFAGTPTGEFAALNANTGEKLWEFNCGSGHHGSCSTYSVDGKQYVVVPVGWGGWLEGIL